MIRKTAFATLARLVCPTRSAAQLWEPLGGTPVSVSPRLPGREPCSRSPVQSL